MKRNFSTAWKSSKQPRKQRKYAAKAPLHIKRKLLSVNLSKDLRKKIGKRNVPVRKGDTIIVMRGKFKKKKGKVADVKTMKEKIYIEGVQIKKRDGSTVNVPLKASNLQLVELNLEDKRRFGKKEAEKKTEMLAKEKTKKQDVKKESGDKK